MAAAAGALFGLAAYRGNYNERFIWAEGLGHRGGGQRRGLQMGGGEELTPLANTRTEFKRTQPAAKNDPTNRQVFRLMLFFPLYFHFRATKCRIKWIFIEIKFLDAGRRAGGGKASG